MYKCNYHSYIRQEERYDHCPQYNSFPTYLLVYQPYTNLGRSCQIFHGGKLFK